MTTGSWRQELRKGNHKTERIFISRERPSMILRPIYSTQIAALGHRGKVYLEFWAANLLISKRGWLFVVLWYILSFHMLGRREFPQAWERILRIILTISWWRGISRIIPEGAILPIFAGLRPFWGKTPWPSARTERWMWARSTMLWFGLISPPCTRRTARVP